MRIVVDFQGAQTSSRLRGIGRYTDSLVREMIRLRGAHEVIVVLNDAFADTILPIRRAFAPLLPPENIRVWSAPRGTSEGGERGKRHRHQAEVIRESVIASLNPDVLLIASMFEGREAGFAASVKSDGFDIPTAIICHDFIPLHFSETYLDPAPDWKAQYLETLDRIARADLILTISENSARDARARLPGGGRVITNISTGLDAIFEPLILPNARRDTLMQRLGIHRPYILTSGSAEPHKNLRLLFRAFARLPEHLRGAHLLVVTGHHTPDAIATLRQWIDAAGLDAGDLVVSGYLPNEDLLTLYTEARLMVFPSLYEGFGLPPLEAMACGTPTLASQAASLPEVVGLPEALFDPHDAGALAALMERGLSDTGFRARLVTHGGAQAAKFTWERSARLALAALEDLVARKPVRPAPDEDPLEHCLRALAKVPQDPAETDALARKLALSFPPAAPARRIFVDISELVERDARTGCQRVTRSILNEWLARPPAGSQIIPVYARPDTSDLFHATAYLAKRAGVAPTGPDLPIDFSPGDIFFGLDLHAHIGPAQAAGLAQMHRMGLRILFFVHDLLPLEFPEFFVEGTQSAHEYWIDVITRFDGVICNSQASADAVRHWQDRTHPPRAGEPFEYHAVHLGADIEGSVPTTGMPADAAAMLARMAERPSFLMTGTLEPRKGHIHALDAFDLLWQGGADVSLVIVGKRGWLVETLAARITSHPAFGTKLFWLEGISDEYLQAVYRQATCLLVASWGEGFGLPVIEAARAGLPILARDLPVFREVAGAHATYFDATCAEGLAGALRAWMSAHAAGHAPGSAGMAVSTWAQCADKIARILLEVPRPT